MDRYLVVFLGGAVGSLARYFIGVTVSARFGTNWPLATFIVNITGSFLIGYIAAFLDARNWHENWRLGLMTGVLGGYTTFSSMQLETWAAWKAGRLDVTLLYPLVSLMVGFLAVALGIAAASRANT